MIKQLGKEEINLSILKAIEDIVAFNIFHRILKGESVLCIGDSKGKLLALQNPGLQIGVWTDRTLPQSELRQMLDELLDLTKDQDQMKMLCSLTNYPLIEELVRSKYHTQVVKDMTLLPYHCPQAAVLSCAPGKMIKAQIEHLEIVAEFLVMFMLDSLSDQMSLESQREIAADLIGRDDLYLWQDGAEIVSMANVTFRSAGYARINCVFTLREQRGRGYGQMLMSTLNLLLLKEGIIPVLYADANYPASNAAYRKSGYLPVYELQVLKLTRR